MITEQNYVGRGNSANNPPQTAQNGLQHPSQPDDWRDELLLSVINNEDAKEGLFDMLYLIWDFKDSGFPIEFIANLFHNWVSTNWRDLNPERYDISQLIGMLSFLTRLSSEFEYFNNNSNYTKKYQSSKREVVHE